MYKKYEGRTPDRDVITKLADELGLKEN